MAVDRPKRSPVVPIAEFQADESLLELQDGSEEVELRLLVVAETAAKDAPQPVAHAYQMATKTLAKRFLAFSACAAKQSNKAKIVATAMLVVKGKQGQEVVAACLLALLTSSYPQQRSLLVSWAITVGVYGRELQLISFY
jgi:hypothetical protein